MRRKVKPIMAKSKSEPKQEMSNHGNQGKTKSSTTQNRDIKCFKCQGRGHIASQCPKKRVMVLKEDGEVESEGEDNIESMPLLDDVDEEENIAQGEMLVARRALSVQVKEDDEVQREKIFHTRYVA